MTRFAMLCWAGGTLLAVVVLLLFFLKVTDVERKIPPDFTRGDQCEKLHVDSTILEPQNTWSNVGYVFAGLLIFYRARRLRSITVGLFMCLTGVFSAMYHAVPTNRTLQTFDIAAVNWVLLALIGYAALAMDRHRHGSDRGEFLEKPIAVLSLVLGTIMAITRTQIAVFESTLATLTLVAILLGLLIWGYFGGKDEKENLSRYEKVTYLTTIVVLALPTALFRLLDGMDGAKEKPLCDADGLFQAHAAWHVLSAALLLIAFDFFARLGSQADERIFADAD